MANEKKQRTVREDLTQALLDLLDTKPYMEITVTDLVNRAGVARVSFYRNFGSVSDVLDAVVQEFALNYTTEVLPVLTSSDERKWREFLFGFFYQSARDSRTRQFPNEQNHGLISSRLGELLAREEEKAAPPRTLAEKYAPTAKWSLLWDVTDTWLRDGMKETPEEMVDWLMSFITQF